MKESIEQKTALKSVKLEAGHEAGLVGIGSDCSDKKTTVRVHRGLITDPVPMPSF